MAQSPYPPPSIYKAEDISETARATVEDICQALSLQEFIASKQQETLGALLEAVSHPTATLLQSYVDEGIHVIMGSPWLRADLDESIRNMPC